MIDISKVDTVLKFALAAAGQEEHPNRELGPIHLVKYVYLADLEYSRTHPGSTFTGTPWRFHHYGPWEEAIFLRIEQVTKEINATERRVASPKYADDFRRWSLDDEELYEQLYSVLPLSVSSAVKSAIHSFGDDTAELLHYVYRTRPMLRAAPGEPLSFDLSAAPSDTTEPELQGSGSSPREPLLVKQKKQRKEARLKLRETVDARLERALAQKKEHKKYTPPRYDEVYFEGLKALDRLAGAPIEEEDGILEVAEETWKSPFRTEDEIP